MIIFQPIVFYNYYFVWLNKILILFEQSEELPLSELSHNTEPPPPSQVHRPHMGVFPPGMV